MCLGSAYLRSPSGTIYEEREGKTDLGCCPTGINRWWGKGFALLGVNASATAMVISRRCNDDDDEISFLVEEPGRGGSVNSFCDIRIMAATSAQANDTCMSSSQTNLVHRNVMNSIDYFQHRLYFLQFAFCCPTSIRPNGNPSEGSR